MFNFLYVAFRELRRINEQSLQDLCFFLGQASEIQCHFSGKRHEKGFNLSVP